MRKEPSAQSGNGSADVSQVGPNCSTTTATPRCRRFKLVDGMILIAAAAVWMALMRPLFNQFQTQLPQIQRFERRTGRAIPWRRYVGMSASGLNTFLLILSVAYVVMRLVSPRPTGAALVRQPGMLFWGLYLVFVMVAWPASAFVELVPWTNILFALALGLPWLVACHRHSARAEPGWIERIGRVLGFGWIVSLTANYLLFLFVLR